MKRSAVVGGVVGGVLVSLSGMAGAFERPDDGATKHGVISVFSDDPMGGGDTAAVLSPPPPKDAPAAGGGTPSGVAPTGFVVAFGGGARGLGGDLGKGISVGAGFVDLEVKAGYFFTQHVGVFVGIDLGVGSFIGTCPSDNCTASRFSLPVSMQVAFMDRAHGPYVDIGLALLSAYKAEGTIRP